MRTSGPTPRRASSTDLARKRPAVCIGAGLVGMAAARVLAAHFDEVVLLERRPRPPDGSTAAHADQLHNFIDPAGLEGLEALFGGLRRQLAARGCRALRPDEVLLDGRLLSTVDAPTAQPHALDRHALDAIVRGFIDHDPRCRVRHEVTVRRLLLAGGRVVGVVVRDATGEHPVRSDLVVDASGRAALGSRLLVRQLGVEPDLRVARTPTVLTSCRMQGPLPTGVRWISAMHMRPVPGSSVFVHPLGRSQWMVTVYSRGARPPPCTLEAIRDAAKGTGEVAEAIAALRPCGPVRRWANTDNVLRRHVLGRRLPAGLVVIGDAACATNPLTSAGVAVGMLSVLALRDALVQERSLARGLARFHLRYERLARRMWQRSVYFEQHELVEQGRGIPTLGYRLWAFYLRRVLRPASWNPRLARHRAAYVDLSADVDELFAPRTVAWACCCAVAGLAMTPLRRLSARLRRWGARARRSTTC